MNYKVTYWTNVENPFNLTIYKEEILIMEGDDTPEIMANFEYYNRIRNIKSEIKRIDIVD